MYHHLFHLFNGLVNCALWHPLTGMDLGGSPRELGPPRSNCFLVIIYFNFFRWAPFQNPKPSFSLVSLTSFIEIAAIQLKNLIKIIKTFIKVIVFQQKIKPFYHQRTKKSCVIGRAKSKFFVITINWYKYLLTIASY